MRKYAADIIPGRLAHGGDYNPDQWLEYPEVLEEDIRLMKEAHINCVSLGIFAWARLEPEDGVYDFDWLEKIVDHLYENGIYTILATPTGALPNWLSCEHEEVRMVNELGQRRFPGVRHNFCPSSPLMRRKMHDINARLSETFGKRPGVVAWHISNEYGGRNGDCHCPHCQEAFRGWLKERYGSLEELNRAWWTGFWSHRITSWDQIHSPSSIGEDGMHGLKLAWRRFCSDQMLDFCKAEIAAVREHSDLPATTNMMGFFGPLDYFKWAKELDFVSDDSYPMWHSAGDDVRVARETSLVMTLIRSLKKEPFLLMESTPSLVNWQQNNMLKRPGVHEMASLQAVAYGSDSVQYFQFRKGRGGNEKFHGAVVGHLNGGNTRTFRDVTRLGERLQNVSEEVLGTLQSPRAAIVFDWENWWDVEDAEALSRDVSYLSAIQDWYKPFFEHGVDVDLINMDEDLSSYDLVVAPLNYMYRGDYADRVRSYVKNGGRYVTTYWSGVVDGEDLCFLGEHPLRDVLGIEPYEIDAPVEGWKNTLTYEGRTYQVKGITQIMEAETAEVLATYDRDFYAGSPALTRNHYGEGQAYLVASENEDAFYTSLMEKLFEELGLDQNLVERLPYGTALTGREGDQGTLYFLQNFNPDPTEVVLQHACTNIETGENYADRILLPPYSCTLLRSRS